jgi:BirA family biotin operon repressor/biotin-[acetyl-CoA-carboxylase] ligase
MSEALAELDSQRLQSLLRTRVYGRSLELRESTDSTNDDAKRAAAQGVPDGHVVLADSQRAGRGQHGRAWASPPGSDLYLSIVARPQLPLAALPPLTLAVGVGVAEAAEQLLADVPSTGGITPALRSGAMSMRAQVKWPNDVLLAGKKCAGVLVETSSGAEPWPTGDAQVARVTVVIGIGLNVNRLQWPDQLRESATSLRAVRPAAQPFDRGVVLAALLLSVEHWVDRLIAEGGAAIASALEARLALRGRRVRSGQVEGTLTGVAASGALRIVTEGGERELLAGRIVPVE